ncbi:MAG: hypothetical protein LBB94_12325 [Clostridiales bacterium]|jgi:phosphotriesterase-related protein|nr:hypothetical protein [Clostridiales bacterium]
MLKIMTVTGPIDPESLGVTSMHEHILMKGGVFRQSYLDENPGITEPVRGDEKVTLENTGLIRRNNMLTWDAQDLVDEEAMGGEIQDFKDSGGNSIVELSVPGLRYDVAGLRRISEKTGVNVVAATGFYLQMSWPKEYLSYEVEDFANTMCNEIRNGIEGTDIKPGVLKIGMFPLSVQEEKALRAAVMVAQETGLSLTVHPSSGIGGDALVVVKLLKKWGMDLNRTVIAHMGGRFFPGDMRRNVLYPETWGLNVDLPKAVLDMGANISIEFLNQSDRELEGSVNPADWMKLAGLVELLRQGYGERIVLGTDLCAKPMARRFGGEGYCRLTSFALPALTGKMGVSPYAVRLMTEENPARILAY